MYNSIKLTIYTQNDCGYCHQLKKNLDSWGYNFDEINISYQIERKVFLKELNLRTVPQLFWNGKHIGPTNNDTLGFTKEMLEAELDYDAYVGGVENFA
tara:strand:+ start:454 stop:747 length:294 start_codon:yes stop_codon:yes gene_type:complete